MALRNERGISQEFIAKKIGLSRDSYIKVEKNKKELTIIQAQKLAEIFDVPFNDIIAGKKGMDVKVSIQDKPEKVNSSEIRINVPQKNLKKFKEVFLYILEKVGSKANVGMTVLYKILYFIDFDYYEKFEEQLVGATYIKNHFGPTPVEFRKIVEQMELKNELEVVKSKYFQHDQTKYLPRRESDISVLSAQEIKHIDEVLSRLSDKSAAELSDYSHMDVPWIVAEDGKVIDYESVFYRTKETSVREYGAD